MRAVTPEEVSHIVKEYDADQRSFMELIVSLQWYMRGGLTREEAWATTPKERELYSELIADRIKLVEKTKLPLL